MTVAPKPGDPAPDFELDGTLGRFRLSEHRGTRVVLLFYPGDFTPVCTRQFCSYADREAELGSLGATVVGISPQDVDSHQEFAAAHDIPMQLLADPERRVARAYGVQAPVVGTRRALFVIDEHGVVRHRQVHRLGLAYATVDDIRAALAALPAAR